MTSKDTQGRLEVGYSAVQMRFSQFAFPYNFHIVGSKEGFTIKLYEQLGSCSVTAFGEIREKEKERETVVEHSVVDNGDGTYTLCYCPSK